MVPGQVITKEIITFMRKLDVKEIHGYNASAGLELLKPDVLDAKKRHQERQINSNSPNSISPLTFLSPLWGERKGEGVFGHLELEFAIWFLEFEPCLAVAKPKQD